MIEEKKDLHHDRFLVQQRTCSCKIIWIDEREDVMVPGFIGPVIRLLAYNFPIGALMLVFET